SSTRVLSACATCLGRHAHKIQDCDAPKTWDQQHNTLAHRRNKQLSFRDGRPLCIDWQCPKGCTSPTHDDRHLCSGCGSTSHGAQRCPRAQ
ncbi:hypothetical protein BJ138DRAFT_990927, partial [Hygrophoropsis aurantiaca]